ncbi:MAG: AraC family transcriptional regulator, partial [Pseudomonadota bacterium]
PPDQFELCIPAVSVMVAFGAGSAWEGVGTDKLRERHFRNRFHFMPANTEMRVRHDTAPPEFLLLGINPEFAHQVIVDMSERRNAERDPLVGEAHTRLLALGDLIRRDLIGRRPLTPLELESLATLFLGEWSDETAKTQLGGASQKMIAIVREFVDAHLHQELTLTDLASIAGLSPSYFLRSFKQATGQTPHRFLMESRVRRARERLEQTDHPLADIAYDCGFASQSHMTDVFRSHLKTSPGRYRRSIRS